MNNTQGIINQLPEISHCIRAIVNYSIEEDEFSKSGFKLNKVVVFYQGSVCTETLNSDIISMMIRHGKSLAKSHVYVTKDSM